MNEEPLVSIVITTYNRAELLQRAIISAVNQTYSNTEIIIVNDGSEDDTDKIVKYYLELFPKLNYIKHELKRGGNSARNTGILAAKGIFIAGLDDDDMFLPNHIQLLIENYDDKYSLICSRSLQLDYTTAKKSYFKPIVGLKQLLLFNALGNQVLVKRDRIIAAGLYDESFIRHQDYDMWVRLVAKFGNAKMISNITQIFFHQHHKKNSDQKENDLRGAMMFYDKHKSLMNRMQRRIQLFAIQKLQNKKINFLLVKDLFFKIFIKINKL
jgi:glycosyltransferase involved in cell wall biosynthesis